VKNRLKLTDIYAVNMKQMHNLTFTHKTLMFSLYTRA